MEFLKALAVGSSFAPRREQKAISAAQPLGVHWNPNQPIRKYDFDPDQAVVKGFKACVWVFACVSLLMRAVGSVPWTAKRRVGDNKRDQWEPDPTDWRSILIENPNTEMTRNFAMAWLTSHLALNGEAPILLNRLNDAGQTAKEMYPLHPHRFAPIAGTNEYVKAYEMYESGVRKIVEKEKIIYTRLPDPDNILRGCGMLQSAWKEVQADANSQAWRADIFERGGIPQGLLTDASLITDDQVEMATDAVEKAWQRASKGGRPMVANAGVNWVPFSFNASDLQLIESESLTISRICAAFGFHPALFSTDASTYDNMRTAIRHYWKNGAIPLLDTFRDSFNLSLVPVSERASVWIDYDLTGVEALQEDTAAQVVSFAQAIASGLSRSEASNMLRMNLPRVDGDEVPLVSPMLRPLADVALGDDGLNDGSEDELDRAPVEGDGDGQ